MADDEGRNYHALTQVSASAVIMSDSPTGAPALPTPTLIEARWIVPVDPAGRVLEDHTLVMADGAIVEIAPHASARERHPAGHRVNLPGHALIPGLVNAHTHAAMYITHMGAPSPSNAS